MLYVILEPDVTTIPGAVLMTRVSAVHADTPREACALAVEAYGDGIVLNPAPKGAIHRIAEITWPN